MTPVDQEFTHDAARGIWGDCQRACVASLLDLPIADVPHFLAEAGGDALMFWKNLQAFLNARGLVYMTFKPFDVEAYKLGYDTPDIYHEICGPSPRGQGLFHAVVGCNGKVVHDPHPSKAGLAGDPSEWEFSLYVRLNHANPPPP